MGKKCEEEREKKLFEDFSDGQRIREALWVIEAIIEIIKSCSFFCG